MDSSRFNKRFNKRTKKFLDFVNVININNRLIKEVYEDTFYNDEPKVYSFTAQLKSTTKFTDGFSVQKLTGGCSFIKERAFLKTIGEALERYSLSIYKEKKFLRDNYNNLQRKNSNSVNPHDFYFFSIKDFRQRPNFIFSFNEKTNFSWIEGYSLTRKRKTLIPAQLVFVPYLFKGEPVIRFPISTGAACYSSLNGAISNGLLEVIERDAFMICYLNKLSRDIIDIRNSKDKELKKIIFKIERYNLKVYVLDISSDVPIYSILVIITDKTGIGPAISCGLKSDFNIRKAIIGAIEESLHVRRWVRDLMAEKKQKINKIQKRKYLISNTEERSMFWSSPEMINKIKFFLKGKKVLINKIPPKEDRNLDMLLRWFRKKKIDVIYVNLDVFGLRQGNINIVKILTTHLQPLYLDERFPYWKGNRLKEVPCELGFKPLKELNKFPHSFL